MQTIEEVCHTRRSRFIAKIKWDSVILKNFETYSNIQINKQNNVGDLRCRVCHLVVISVFYTILNFFYLKNSHATTIGVPKYCILMVNHIIVIL